MIPNSEWRTQGGVSFEVPSPFTVIAYDVYYNGQMFVNSSDPLAVYPSVITISGTPGGPSNGQFNFTCNTWASNVLIVVSFPNGTIACVINPLVSAPALSVSMPAQANYGESFTLSTVLVSRNGTVLPPNGVSRRGFSWGPDQYAYSFNFTISPFSAINRFYGLGYHFNATQMQYTVQIFNVGTWTLIEEGNPDRVVGIIQILPIINGSPAPLRPVYFTVKSMLCEAFRNCSVLLSVWNSTNAQPLSTPYSGTVTFVSTDATAILPASSVDVTISTGRVTIPGFNFTTYTGPQLYQYLPAPVYLTVRNCLCLGGGRGATVDAF